MKTHCTYPASQAGQTCARGAGLGSSARRHIPGPVTHGQSQHERRTTASVPPPPCPSHPAQVLPCARSPGFLGPDRLDSIQREFTRPKPLT